MLYFSEEQQMREEEDIYATIAEADRFDAEVNGESKPWSRWICSDRDVWYENPYYTGSKDVRDVTTHHPECYCERCEGQLGPYFDEIPKDFWPRYEPTPNEDLPF